MSRAPGRKHLLLVGAAAALFTLSTIQARAQTPAPAASPAPVAGPAPPASPAPAILETIIVTAEKRKANLQSVPVTVTALSAHDIASQGINGTQALSASVPSLVITNPANVGNPYLRGVGSNLFDPSSEQSVAMYVDGVYIASPQANIFDFNNVTDIEVLKGPQGTLFGRNATGGVIQINTRDPSSIPRADLSVGYGSYNTLQSSAYLSGGLSDKLTADFAGMFENQGTGFGKNLTTHTQDFQEAIGNYALRSKVMFKPLDTTKLVLSIDFSHSVETNAYQKPQGVHSPFDGSTYPGPYNSLGDLNDRNTVNTGGGSLRFDQDIGDYHLLDIAAYRRSDVTYPLDDDVTALEIADIVLHPVAHNYSEELQISSPAQSWFRWIAGGYYYNAYAGYAPVIIDGFETIADTQTTVSYAGFGQATAQILPRTDLTLGIRYTTEEQNFQLTFPAALRDSQSFGKFTYRAALDYHFTPDILDYVSYNTGFKSGGYNLLLPGNGFRPEILDATEVGLKTEFLDHTVRLNLDGFYYKDHNVQVLSAFEGGTITSNAAEAEIKGIEAEFTIVPLPNFKISGGIALQRGTYTDYPEGVKISADGVAGVPVSLAGNNTIVTPAATGSLNLNRTWETQYGDLDATVSGVFNSGFYWQSDNRLTQPGYALLNASLLFRLMDDRYTIRLWGKNLTDSVYYLARLGAAGLGDVQEQAPPRTFGVTLAAHF